MVFQRGNNFRKSIWIFKINLAREIEIGLEGKRFLVI